MLMASEDMPGAIDQFDRHFHSMSEMTVDDPLTKLVEFAFYKWQQQE
jgi:hypothetical protein